MEGIAITINKHLLLGVSNENKRKQELKLNATNIHLPSRMSRMHIAAFPYSRKKNVLSLWIAPYFASHCQ